MPTNKSLDQSNLPDESCRALKIPDVAKFAFCLGEFQSTCPHSLHFGNVYICRHVTCQEIVKKTGERSD